MDAPGWYGKLPALGDFARRRLPVGFVERWDSWLQLGLSASREALGDAWLTQYLSCHVWRFVLMPGVVGSGGWAGVLMPSVDHVGRYFPLTLCCELPADAALGASLAGFEDWLAGLERCALAALDPERGLDRLESDLQHCLPPALQRTDDPSAQQFATFSAGEAPSGFLDRIAAGLLPQRLAGRSLWWCRDDKGSVGGFVATGLPDTGSFTRMLGFQPQAAPSSRPPP